MPVTGSEGRAGLARGPRLVAAGLALALAAPACSFATVRRTAPIHDPTVADGCTRSPAPPIIDTVGVVVGGVTTLAALSVRSFENAFCEPDCHSNAGVVAAVAAGATAVSAASMVYGYVSTQRCRRNAELASLCASGDRAACEELKPGWMPPPDWSPPPTWRSPPRTGAEPPPAPDRE